MGKRARWLSGGLFLMAVLGFGWGKLPGGHEPIAKWPMPDGTELRLEEMTYGTDHPMRGAGKIVGWLTQKAAPYSHGHIAPLAAAYEYTTSEPTVLLWFTRYNPRTGTLSSDPAYSRLLLDEDAPRVSYSQNDQNLGPRPHVALKLEHFDRRSPIIRLRVAAEGKPFDIEVPNPAAGVTFPQWQPEPLPQTRQAGPYAIILRSLDAVVRGPGRIVVLPTIEVRREGKVTDETLTDPEWRDATGNWESGEELQTPLPAGEHAWMLRATFTVGIDENAVAYPVEFIVAPPKVPDNWK